jgi:hypothetical protein
VPGLVGARNGPVTETVCSPASRSTFDGANVKLRGARLVEPTRPGKLPLHRGGRGPPARSVATVERLVAWLLQRQAAADLRRLKHLLETSTVSGSAPEETAT